MSQKGIPLFLSFGLLVFVAIVTSGVLFTWLSRWHDTKLYTRQSQKNVKFMVDSVRSRIAAPVVVEDYDQVDLIMRESFGTDMNVVEALVINNQGEVYYDLAGNREGRTFDESLMPQGEYVFDEPIELLGGMGFMVPDGSVVGRLIVEARVFDPITDKQLSSLMHYSRALISDLNAKLENNEVFGARSILANMLQNSDSVNYVQWIDQEGMIRAHMDKDNPEGGDTSIEGTRIADNDSIGARAMSVTVRKPLLIQEVGTLKGAPLMDIAIPLVYKGEKVGVVRIGYSNREFADTRRQARNAMVVIICAFLVSGLLLGFAVAYPMARPIQALASAARKAALGDLDQQVLVNSGTRELNLLAQDFNSMICHRAAAEKALRESEEKFRRLFDAAPDIILRWSPAKGVEYINPAIEKTIGYEVDLLMGQSGFLMSRMHPDDLKVFTQAVVQGSGINGAPRPLNIRLFHKDGALVHMEAQFFPVLDDQGNVASVECIARDVTERLRAQAEKEELQEQLLQMQKMEAVGQLAGGIAHDFNNMLTVVMANADLGLIYADKGTRFHQYFKDIMLATERARNLTMKLLTFARKEKVNVQDICISDAVRELMSMLERSVSRDIILKTVVKADPVVRVDVTQLQQSLLNICTNAVDAMPEGGTLTVLCDKAVFEEKDWQPHSAHKPGVYCLVRISDTGVGISSEILPRVCEPFFTTKGLGKGTGLGLSTTHGIVESHGGFMQFQSEPGQGTSVTLYLPAADVEIIKEEAAVKPSPADAAPGGTETIMIVDDEETVLDAAASVLEQAGYSVLKATGGREAIELYKNHSGRVGLVVCDMIMPGMDGAETYNALRELDPDVAVVLASGYSIEGKAGALLADGVRGFVQKPFTYDALCSTVRDVLDKKA